MVYRIVALVSFVFVALVSEVAFSRPYHGDIFSFTQPDGTKFQVRLYGDEYYAVIETLDGYTLTKDLQTGFYCYALPAPDGMSFISTGYKPGEQLPPNLVLQKNARLSRQKVKELSDTARARFGVDSKGRLLPSLGLQLRPRDYGYERWTTSLETLAAAFEKDPESIPQAPPVNATTGTRVGLVLLAQFPDLPEDVTISQSEIDAYANDPNYSNFGNATSVYGYFNIQSDGKLQYNSLVTAYFTAAQNRDYYTDNAISYTTRARELINEGLEVLKAKGFDFTQADADGDAVLDGVNCFYAGERVNNWSEGLWPHKSNWFWAGLSGEGVSTSYQYQITNIGSSLSLGTYCHENGHMICNFPDLYSYDNNAANLANYSLMHTSGSKHPVNVDPYLKTHAGWSMVVDIASAEHLRGALQVDRNTFYRYRNPADSQEYFLLSIRRDSGYEGMFGGSFLPVNPTNGLVVWHALETGSNTHSSIVTDDVVTDYSTPYELMVVEANPDSLEVPWYDEPLPGSNDGYHAGDVNEVSDSTTPALRFWSATGRTIASNMHVHTVSALGDTMTFIAGTGALAGPAEISLTVSSLASATDFGTDAAVQSFAVFNSGAGVLNYSITDNAGWLSVSPSSGAATTEADQITVAYDTNALAVGGYNATITITDGGASNSPQTIPVSLTVHPQPAIALNPAALSESLAAGTGGTGSFTVLNSGGGTLDYTFTESASWLTLSTYSGTAAAEVDEIEVVYDASHLFDGIYSESITVGSANATNSPQEVEVELTVSGRVEHIMVFSPDGNETLWQGNRQDIRWLTDGMVTGNVRIELYKGGILDTVISPDTPNDGFHAWNIGPGQTIGSDYRIRVTSINEPGYQGESSDYFTVSALPSLAVLPYSESFESGLGIWVQSTDDDFDWTRRVSATPSFPTGPASAFDGSYYLYTESSGPNYPDKAAILEGYFDLRAAAAPILSFYYHMYGESMGNLLVEATMDLENWTPLFSRSWSQGDSWHQAHVDLSPFAGKAILIRITGTTGEAFWSDMALDALTLTESARILSYSADVFSESVSDDGSITTSVVITLSGDTFTGPVVSAGYVTVDNVPSGLSAQFARDSATQLTFNLSGNAVSHASKDSVSDLRVEFTDGAFTGGNASAVAGNAKLMTVDYIEILALPEIDIQGNGISIADGDLTPAEADHTDFGSADISSSSIDRIFTVVNTGTGTLHLTGTPRVEVSGADAADFTVTVDPSSTVAPGGGGTTFTVRFDPAATGVRSATLSIANDDPDENPYDFSIQGTGASSPEVEVQGNGITIVDGDTTPSLTDHTDFDSTGIGGGTVDRTFTIANSGSGFLNLTGLPMVVVSGAHGSDFTVTVDPESPVSPGGGSTAFTVRFDPVDVGLRTATLSIANDDADEDPYNFSIQGNGVLVPDVEIDVRGNGVSIVSGDATPSLTDHTDFDVARVQDETIDRTFTIFNTGSTVLSLSGVQVNGGEAADFTVVMDPAGSVTGAGSTLFTVRFDPGGKGLRRATISIGNDDTDENPYTFAIQGTGTGFPWTIFFPAMIESSP